MQHLSAAAVVFISVFFEYFVVRYFKYLIIGIKGYLQSMEDTYKLMKLYFLEMLSQVEILMNGSRAISTDKLHPF